MKTIINIILAFFFGLSVASAQTSVKGLVYLDNNRNLVYDKNEKPLAGVLVSNGTEVIKTDKNGRWKLTVDDDTGLFVIKPSGYQVPVNANQVPQHFYLHKPAGSPPLAVPGVGPTGELPQSIDFALWPGEITENFKVLLFGDPQARGITEVNYIMNDVVQECIGTDALMGISLGDIVADNPNLFAEISAGIGQIGIPWYNIFGNHDNNRDASEDRFSDETFERFFGPSTFAFEQGQVAFIGLKNIYFPPGKGYQSHISDQQLQFVRNYLQQVVPEKLVVLLMHAPINYTDNKEELFSILSSREYTLSIAGHTHRQDHFFLDQEEGWNGKNPHHHFINATISGSWWCGMKDELGIPHTVMNDGGPNGYSILSFEGNQYKINFKAARRMEDISADSLQDLEILVNVFAGSEKSLVEMEIDRNGKWFPLENTIAADPACLAMHSYTPFLDHKVHGKNLDELFGWPMDKPSRNRHMWKARLPTDLPPGTHLLTVKTRDMFGQEYSAHKVFRINQNNF